MTNFADSETRLNLMKAFAGESQASNRYTFFSKKARDEGYKQIEAIFLETAENEREHASVFYKHLVKNLGADEAVVTEFTADYPVALSEKTETNLLSAAGGEQEEYEVLYPSFGKKAEEEGFNDIAQSFYQIAKVEKEHMDRYNALAKNIHEGKVFKKDKPVLWKCRNCGYIVEAVSAPAKCPACQHPQSYFEIAAKNW